MIHTATPHVPTGQAQINAPFDKSNWITISANYEHAAAIDANGYVWTWGKNDKGQLGLGPGKAAMYTTPQRVATIKAIAVATGTFHTLIIDEQKQVWGAGLSVAGVLGIQGQTDPLWNLTQLGGFTRWGDLVEIYSKRDLAIARTQEGMWLSWGDNTRGGVGVDSSDDYITAPVVLFGRNNTIVQVSVGIDIGAAVSSDGDLWVWGDNTYKQISAVVPAFTGGKAIDVMKATTKAGEWAKVAAGQTHLLGLTRNNTLWAWGRGTSGQLGLGDGMTQAPYTPMAVEVLPYSGIKSYVSIEASKDCSGAVTVSDDGTRSLYLWGNNGYGQVTSDADSYSYGWVPDQPIASSDIKTWFALQLGDGFTTALA